MLVVGLRNVLLVVVVVVLLTTGEAKQYDRIVTTLWKDESASGIFLLRKR